VRRMGALPRGVDLGRVADPAPNGEDAVRAVVRRPADHPRRGPPREGPSVRARRHRARRVDPAAPRAPARARGLPATAPLGDLPAAHLDHALRGHHRHQRAVHLFSVLSAVHPLPQSHPPTVDEPAESPRRGMRRFLVEVATFLALTVAIPVAAEIALRTLDVRTEAAVFAPATRDDGTPVMRLSWNPQYRVVQPPDAGREFTA